MCMNSEQPLKAFWRAIASRGGCLLSETVSGKGENLRYLPERRTLRSMLDGTFEVLKCVDGASKSVTLPNALTINAWRREMAD